MYYKLGQTTYVTGQSRVQFQGIEVGRDTSTPATDFYSTGSVPPPPVGGTSGVRNLARLHSRLSEDAAGSIQAYTEAAAANRGSQAGDNIVTIDSNGVFQEIADGNDGQILTTDGNGVYTFEGEKLVLASISARASTQYTSNYYYGNSAYGFNYPIWSGITFNNTQGNPYALQISDDYAHNGVTLAHDATAVTVQGSIRNDSSTDNLEVLLAYGDRPNGSSSNIQLTSLGTASVTVSSTDRHYNFKISGGAVGRGKLIFLGIRRTTGTTTTRYVNFTATIEATL